jgi:hypothetical protein
LEQEKITTRLVRDFFILFEILRDGRSFAKARHPARREKKSGLSAIG